MDEFSEWVLKFYEVNGFKGCVLKFFIYEVNMICGLDIDIKENNRIF